MSNTQSTWYDTGFPWPDRLHWHRSPSLNTCSTALQIHRYSVMILSKKISNDQELIQSDPISCPQNQKGNN